MPRRKTDSPNWGGKRANQHGRTPLPADVRTETLSASIPHKLCEAVRARAAERCTSVSRIVREILEAVF